jgi:hypothetical protein
MADFNIKVTVPDAKATEILTGITNELGYRDLEDPKPSRQAFLRQMYVIIYVFNGTDGKCVMLKKKLRLLSRNRMSNNGYSS